MTEHTPTFEVAYARLEEILEQMNAGKTSLEDSLKLYEEADKLIGWCSKKLTDAEKKIEVLIKNREAGIQLDGAGNPQAKPFSPAGHTVLT